VGYEKIKEEVIETTLYIFIGIFLAFFINKGIGIILSTDMPIVAVESNSMVPTFYKGDILIIKGENNYSIGDIIVFSPSQDSVPIVHRVIEINEDGTYQTAGDANHGKQLPFEKRIETKQIHGKMIFRIPYLGWIKLLTMDLIFKHPIEFILIILTITFIYIFLHK